MLKKLVAGERRGNIGKAQIKISFITIYYVMLGVMGLVSLTYFGENTVDIMQPSLAFPKDFLLCKSLSNPDCVLNEILGRRVPILSTIASVTVSGYSDIQF